MKRRPLHYVIRWHEDLDGRLEIGATACGFPATSKDIPALNLPAMVTCPECRESATWKRDTAMLSTRTEARG